MAGTQETEEVAASQENPPTLLDQQLSMYIHFDVSRAKPGRLHSHCDNLVKLIHAVENHPSLAQQKRIITSSSSAPPSTQVESSVNAAVATTKKRKKSKWDDEEEEEVSPLSKAKATQHTSFQAKDTQHIAQEKDTQHIARANDTHHIAQTKDATQQHISSRKGNAPLDGRTSFNEPSNHVPLYHGCRSVHAYEQLNKIDEGTYGVVFRARDLDSGEVVALKQVKMVGDQEGFPITALRETNILLSLRHPNVVRVKEMVVERSQGAEEYKVYMVMDFWPHDLRTVMRGLEAGRFAVPEAKCLLAQLLSGLAHCHERWYLHRDLKCSNVLYDAGRVAIADFGMARKFDDPLGKYTQMVVTLHYRAPELLLGAAEYSTPVDVWSAGCILAELLTGKVLFPGRDELGLLRAMCQVLGPPSEREWPGMEQLPYAAQVLQFRADPLAKSCAERLREHLQREAGGSVGVPGGLHLSDAGMDLLSKLVCYDPSKRLSASEALKHPWFTEAPLARRVEDMP